MLWRRAGGPLSIFSCLTCTCPFLAPLLKVLDAWLQQLEEELEDNTATQAPLQVPNLLAGCIADRQAAGVCFS